MCEVLFHTLHNSEQSKASNIPAFMKGNKWKMIKHTGLFLYDRCYEGNKLVGQTMTGLNARIAKRKITEYKYINIYMCV